MFKCKACGKTTKSVLIDGYRLHDLLTDVLFKVSRNEAGKINVKIDPDSADYFNYLNKTFWYKQMREYFPKWLPLDCPHCNEEELN